MVREAAVKLVAQGVESHSISAKLTRLLRRYVSDRTIRNALEDKYKNLVDSRNAKMQYRGKHEEKGHLAALMPPPVSGRVHTTGTMVPTSISGTTTIVSGQSPVLARQSQVLDNWMFNQVQQAGAPLIAGTAMLGPEHDSNAPAMVDELLTYGSGVTSNFSGQVSGVGTVAASASGHYGNDITNGIAFFPKWMTNELITKAHRSISGCILYFSYGVVTSIVADTQVSGQSYTHSHQESQ